jgi:DNA-binding transcriptional regulator LsrR (DeoR family)
MHLSRQTVSKLLNDALTENIVEIKIHNPEVACAELERELCARTGLANAVVCGVSSMDESLRQMMTVRAAAGYLQERIARGGQRIGISWGRTIQMLVSEFPNIATTDNVVFPLFGATDQEESYFLSNELARSFADKIDAKVRYAWFPYKPDSDEDSKLFRNTSYYKKVSELWNSIDIAVVGIGNSAMLQSFGKIFGYNEKSFSAVGDISTHFFDGEGKFVELYENTLCASVDNLRNAKHTIAIASGDNKVEAIIGALRTGVVDTLIADEYTVRKILG